MALPYGSLGADVFCAVLEYLPKNDLLSACLTNKEVGNHAERYLYRRINWNWTSTSKPPIAAFLNTVMRRPELGRHVRILDLTSKDVHVLMHDDKPEPQLVAATLERLVRCPTELWRTLISEGYTDALLALLLLHTPLLTHLHCDQAWSWSPYWVGYVLTAALHAENSHMPRFEKLQVITHRWSYLARKSPTLRSTLLPHLIHLPAIRRLDVAFNYPPSISFQITSPCANLVDLTICDVREAQLYNLLSVTTTVRQLHWKINYHSALKNETNTNLLDLDALMKALKLLQHQLEALKISLVFEFEERGEDELRTTGSARGLSEFKALREICVPVWFLNDFQPDNELYDFHSVMTEATESLTLTSDLWKQSRWQWINMDRLMYSLEQMLEDRPEQRYPNLDEIVFQSLDPE